LELVLLLEKLAYIAIKNGPNFIVAFSDQHVLQMSYFGHSLDLAISKGLQLVRVGMAIKKCHTLLAGVRNMVMTYEKSKNL